MKEKLFDFIKSPKFIGASCLIAAGFFMGSLITDDIPVLLKILYIVVFWALVINGCYIFDRLAFDKELNIWIRQCYNEKIYRECDKGEKEFNIDMPNIIAVNYIDYVGKNFPYFTSWRNGPSSYVITDYKINEDNNYTTFIFTKIK